MRFIGFTIKNIVSAQIAVLQTRRRNTFKGR